MIVWQGLGALAFLIPAILYHLFNYGADAMFGAGYSHAHNSQTVVGLLVSAVIVAALGFWLDSFRKRTVPPKNGWERLCYRRHTLFFIPMQYVSVVLVVIAVYLTVHKPGV
jgi:hypothetical protein